MRDLLRASSQKPTRLTGNSELAIKTASNPITPALFIRTYNPKFDTNYAVVRVSQLALVFWFGNVENGHFQGKFEHTECFPFRHHPEAANVQDDFGA